MMIMMIIVIKMVGEIIMKMIKGEKGDLKMKEPTENKEIIVEIMIDKIKNQ